MRRTEGEEDGESARAGYGDALREHVEAAAAGRADLRVPVQVIVDLDTSWGPGEDSSGDGVAGQLPLEAVAAVPAPSAPTVG